jgi:RNA polymerase sigma-70 factor, ECF subfamily
MRSRGSARIWWNSRSELVATCLQDLHRMSRAKATIGRKSLARWFSHPTGASMTASRITPELRCLVSGCSPRLVNATEILMQCRSFGVLDRVNYKVMPDSESSNDFAALYDQTVDDVYRYASRLTGGNRELADDLVQETYLGVLRRLQRGEHQELSTAYLIVACRSRFLDDLKSRQRRRRREGSAAHRDIVAIANDVPDSPATVALAALEPDQRAALVLRYVDDLAVADVARQLGRSLHATESLLTRARTALRAALKKGTPS